MTILFLTHRLPYAPNRGDRIRAYYLMREMSRFADVSLFSLIHDDEEAAHADKVPFASRVATSRVPRVRNLVRGAVGLPSSRPLTHTLLDAPDVQRKLTALVGGASPDLVFAYCSGMARFALEAPLSRFPLAVDFVDVDSEKWRHLSLRSPVPQRWIFAREARTLAAFERRAIRRAKAVIVVNERERQALDGLAATAPVHVIGNGIDAAAFAPPGPPAEDPVVVFCGVMDYEPNVEAMCWFAGRVWPRIREAKAHARFVIVGANPTHRVRALAVKDPSIEITGRVQAVQPYLWRGAVSVAPLQLARGLQNKVLEALAAGLPVVVTSAVSAGLPATVAPGCLVADEPDAFASRVLDLLNQSSDVRRAMAAASRVETLAWSAGLTPLRAILEAAASDFPRAGVPSTALA
jgi:sugar transferase (PEP-CTERM/EpsH1 system associated)